MRTTQKTILLCAGLILGAGVTVAQGVGTASGYPVPKDDLTTQQQTGKGLYLRYCVGCHGKYGDGEGENAPYIDPKPRDFTVATFKCRSTPTGTLPLDSDLIHTIERGIRGSNMPSWLPLSDENREDLIAYIKTFSPRWKKEKPGDPIQIPPEPAVTAERITAGQAMFKKLECWKCHGVEGRGNGPSAATLTDDKDRPITPYDFTTGHKFKCGVTDQDVYRIFMTGLDGTPMPSFADNVKPDEAWDLVFYLRTFQMHTREKEMAKQMGLKPIDPNAPNPTDNK
ncbi:MAG: cytochrome c [Acidobacteriia bacterium]|nr:cytochrome c [Terriglobia bacterium]